MVIAGVQLIDFLISHRLLERADIVDRPILIRRERGRNLNFSVTGARSTALFVKQNDSGEGNLCAQEANAYLSLESEDSLLCNRFFPSMLGYDKAASVLVLEYLDSARTLASLAVQNPAEMSRIAGEIGSLLGRLHEIPIHDRTMRAPVPWISSICWPQRNIVPDFSAASIEIIRTIHGIPGIKDILDSLFELPNDLAFIHGDVRWDNLLILSTEPDQTHNDLFLVDYELSGLGHAMWDVACVLAEFLNAWVRSMPVSPDLSVDLSASRAKIRIDSQQSLIQEFVRSYREGRTSGPVIDGMRVARMTAARLFQSAIELSQNLSTVPGSAVLTLQLAANMIERPRDAAAQILNIDPSKL